jgi:aspartate oxidase
VAGYSEDTDNITNQVRSLLWEKVGIMRNGKELCHAVKRLESMTLPETSEPARKHYEAQNILAIARLIARCALARQESRGAHYRADFPLKHDSQPPKHSFISKSQTVYFE